LRSRKLITLIEAHVKWLEENNISLSRFVQAKINEEIEKSLAEKGRVFEPEN